jgi:hypothetical protein
MTKLTHAVLAAAALALVAVSPATASAAPDDSGAAQMPLTSKWRACDFTVMKWPDATGYGRPFAQVSSSAGTVTANVTINTAQPNTHYDVRVIQTPRPSIGCAPGAPGVITGGLQTDGAGVGGVSLVGPVASGATGAWVIVSRPAAHSQTPEEFYTTTFIAAI